MDQVMMSVFSFSLGSHDRSFKPISGPPVLAKKGMLKGCPAHEALTLW